MNLPMVLDECETEGENPLFSPGFKGKLAKDLGVVLKGRKGSI